MALALAVLSIVVWFTVIVRLHPGPIVDEVAHFAVAEQLTHGQWPWRGQIPMLPSAHLLIAAVFKITGPSLTAGRAVSAGLTICAILLFHSAVRIRHPEAAGWQTLLMAWNPLFVPYCVLIYTEPASMLAVVAGLYFHVRRKSFWAALALLAACLIRQSNIVWAALFVVWLMVEPHQPASATSRFGPQGRFQSIVRRWLVSAWPYLGLMGMFVAVLLLRPGLVLTPTSDNRAGFNPAQYYLFFFIIVVVLLPIWAEKLRRSWARVLAPKFARAGACTGLVAVIGMLVMLYDNPHHWNACQEFLHNVFTVLLYKSVGVRYLVSTLIVVAVIGLAMPARRPHQRAMLITAWVFVLLFLAPHRLVDNRYYILPLLLINFFSKYEAPQYRRLVLWQFTLAAAAAAYTVRYAGPESGL